MVNITYALRDVYQQGGHKGHPPGSPSRGQDAMKTRHVLSPELRPRSRAI